MGGRGSSSGGAGGGSAPIIAATSNSGVPGWTAGGAFGGWGSLAGLVNAQQQSGNNTQQFNQNGDYDAGGNPNLIKFQQQDDDKTAKFIARQSKIPISQYEQSHPDTQFPNQYYENSLQKMLLSMGLNDKPAVLSTSEFNKYIKQSGNQVMWRGWSGDNSADRFMQSNMTHVGNGVFSDGYYFSSSHATANNYSYASSGTGNITVTRMALSPTARVIDVTTLRQKMASMSPNLQASLRHTGQDGSRSYGGNNGEALAALKLGYNVIQSGGYLCAVTRDAFVVEDKKYH